MKKTYIITGTSGAGKSTLIPFLRKLLPGYLIHDVDDYEGANWQYIKHALIKVSYNALQTGIQSIIVGTIVPENLFDSKEAKKLEIQYFNIIVEDDVIKKRLIDRKWNQDMIDNYIDFNHWLKENKDIAFNPPMIEIIQASKSVEEQAKEIYDVIKAEDQV